MTISECCRSHPGELDKPEAGISRRQSGGWRWIIFCGDIHPCHVDTLQGQTGGILRRIFPNTRGMYLLDLLWILAAITQNKESLWALWARVQIWKHNQNMGAGDSQSGLMIISFPSLSPPHPPQTNCDNAGFRFFSPINPCLEAYSLLRNNWNPHGTVCRVWPWLWEF